MGATLRTTQKRITPSTGVHTRKTRASSAFIHMDRPMPITSITGERTSGRSPPLTAFCSTVTSVVMRVTSEDVSNRSRLEKA